MAAKLDVLDTFCVNEEGRTTWACAPQFRNFILKNHGDLLGYDITTATFFTYEAMLTEDEEDDDNKALLQEAENRVAKLHQVARDMVEAYLLIDNFNLIRSTTKKSIASNWIESTGTYPTEPTEPLNILVMYEEMKSNSNRNNSKANKNNNKN